LATHPRRGHPSFNGDKDILQARVSNLESPQPTEHQPEHDDPPPVQDPTEERARLAVDQAIRHIEDLSNRSQENPPDQIELYIASLELEDAIGKLDLVAGQTQSSSRFVSTVDPINNSELPAGQVSSASRSDSDVEIQHRRDRAVNHSTKQQDRHRKSQQLNALIVSSFQPS